MTTGLTGLQAAAEEQRAKAAAFKDQQRNFVPFAKLEPNKPYIIRFLEQGDDVAWCWAHELPPEQGRSFGGVTPCLNQDGKGQACPGCEMGKKRKIQGWINIIMRDAPLFERGSDGKIIRNPMTQAPNVVGSADQVFVWNSGSNLFSTLGNKDRAFKGLMSRDFEVIRTGEKFQTAYSIEPVDADSGPQPMSKADLELAANKADTNEFLIPETYEIAKALLQGVPRQAVRQFQAPEAASNINIFQEKLNA